MTLGDLYPYVRLYSEVETIIMTGEEGVGGHMGRVDRMEMAGNFGYITNTI